MKRLVRPTADTTALNLREVELSVMKERERDGKSCNHHHHHTTQNTVSMINDFLSTGSLGWQLLPDEYVNSCRSKDGQ